jgi:PAS domain S-box-containing protein
MGGGISRIKNGSTAEVSRKERNPIEVYTDDKNANFLDNGNLSERRVKCVDAFVKEVYILKKNEQDAMASIFSCKRSRESYLDFVEASSKNAKPVDTPDIDEEVLKNAIQKLKAYDDETITKETARNKINVINKLNKFGDYLLAPAYGVWRASESGLANEAVGEHIIRSSGCEEENSLRENSAHKIFLCMNEEDLNKAVGSSTWITKFITAVEKLPLGIIVANHRDGEESQDRRLSIMYVNRKFETITGYTKADAIGKNPKFLQGADTNPLQLKEMSRVIRDVCSYSSVVCNYRKNGEQFFNHISFKPIIDQNQSCQYWIGLMEDVSNQEECDLHYLLEILPNRVIVNQN